jgi:hypothetical protein
MATDGRYPFRIHSQAAGYDMSKLTPLERYLLTTMIGQKLGDHSPFHAQLNFLDVTNRKMTGVGFFTNLRLTDGTHRGTPQKLVITSVDIKFPAISPTAIGFSLFIENGAISMLEGYTFGNERWPDEDVKAFNDKLGSALE